MLLDEMTLQTHDEHGVHKPHINAFVIPLFVLPESRVGTAEHLAYLDLQYSKVEEEVQAVKDQCDAAYVDCESCRRNTEEQALEGADGHEGEEIERERTMRVARSVTRIGYIFNRWSVLFQCCRTLCLDEPRLLCSHSRSPGTPKSLLVIVNLARLHWHRWLSRLPQRTNLLRLTGSRTTPRRSKSAAKTLSR